MSLPPATSRRSRRSLVSAIAAVTLVLVAPARTALVVNNNLGTLGNGAVNLAGTTVGGPNNANNYTNANPQAFWGSEYVYQFTLAALSAISITSDDPNAAPDNDFFVVATLETTPNGALNVGQAAGHFVEISGSLGAFEPGTYYLVVDAYAAGNSGGSGNAGAFNAVLTVAPSPGPPVATPVLPGGSITTTLAAGQVRWFSFNHPGGEFGVETLGSNLGPANDTELFVFSAGGTLLAENDDGFADGVLSRLSTPVLRAGTYYLAAAGYNSAGSDGFVVTSTSVESGDLTIAGLHASGPIGPPVSTPAAPGGSIATMLGANQVLWYSFTHPGGAISIDTVGSMTGPVNDTELFLVTSAGVVVAANDDIDFEGGDFLSWISLTDLPAGTYYLAVAGYDTIASAGFFASSDSPETGDLTINGLMIPAAATHRLSAVSLVGNSLTLRLNGTVGRTYRIEKAVSPGGLWATDGADVTLATPEQTFVRSVLPADRRLFHRATELP